jgi:hypothetical protein
VAAGQREPAASEGREQAEEAARAVAVAVDAGGDKPAERELMMMPIALMSRARGVCTTSRRHAKSRIAVALLCALAVCTQLVAAQALYSTPDDAAKAFADALATNDKDALEHVLGKDFRRFIPTSNIGQEDIYDFLGAWSKGHQIINDAVPIRGHPSAHLAVGPDEWTLPIPLVRVPQGWRFDPVAGRQEMLTRRIGRNERAAILTALAYIDAQNDYFGQMRHYARLFVSTPGLRDGLYWPTASGEPNSPLGPLAEAMPPKSVVTREGYHGYRFRILSGQGSHATGGEKSYLENNSLEHGFGLIAWPARYGETGVMSFIVNQDGQIYQKDLGPNTASTAAAVRAYDPDSSWQRVTP